jgi:hypothetical protein
MTIIEYRPGAEPGQWKQPDHLSDRPSFSSKRLGRIVSTAGVAHLSWEDLDELYEELEQEIHTLASRISSQQWPLPDLRRMRAKKARWGAVHQALIRRRGEMRRVIIKTERRRRHLEGTNINDHFIDIAREELPKELFDRLLQSAKERHSEFQAELASMDGAQFGLTLPAATPPAAP